MMERFFQTLLADPKCTARVYNELLKDLRLAFRFGKRSLPERWDEYFEDIEERALPKKKKQVFDAEAVIEKIHNERLPLLPRLFLAFIFVMNCRPQDMFALRWTDLNLETGEVTFGNAVKRTEEGWETVEGTKTGEYDGDPLPLGSLLTGMLKRAYNERRKAGKLWPWVFCREDGKRLDNDHFSHYLWPKIKAALELPDGPTFYSIKTLGNSYWLANGVPVAVQARKMRHKSERMAQTTYRTIFGKEMEQAVDLKAKDA